MTIEAHPNLRDLVRPAKLMPGDKVRFLSPASSPDKAGVFKRVGVLESWGLAVDFGEHAFEKTAYLAGTDEQRLADFNTALRDPSVRAIFATRGGKGSYRIADRLDFEALERDPKFIVGFSDITILHLSFWKHSQLPGIHGALLNDEFGLISSESAASICRMLMSDEDLVLQSRHEEETSRLTSSGRAQGLLMGGNLEMLATAAGWILPDLKGCILLLEAANMYLGQIDRQLTMLRKGGHFEGIQGVAVGQFTDCPPSGSWTVNDVLHQHLSALNVPVLGGLPIGHGRNAQGVPLGTMARIDTETGSLTVAPATVRTDTGMLSWT